MDTLSHLDERPGQFVHLSRMSLSHPERYVVFVLATRQPAAAEEGRRRTDRLLLRGQRDVQAGRLLLHLPHLLPQIHLRRQGVQINL